MCHTERQPTWQCLHQLCCCRMCFLLRFCRDVNYKMRNIYISYTGWIHGDESGRALRLYWMCESAFAERSRQGCNEQCAWLDFYVCGFACLHSKAGFFVLIHFQSDNRILFMLRMNICPIESSIIGKSRLCYCFVFSLACLNLRPCLSSWLVASMVGYGSVAAHVCQTQDGFTALMSAAQQGHTDCVRLLVKGGADKEAKDNVRGVNILVI